MHGVRRERVDELIEQTRLLYQFQAQLPALRSAAKTTMKPLKSRSEDNRDRELRALKEKIGDLTMANELLKAKFDRMEAGTPFARRRSRR